MFSPAPPNCAKTVSGKQHQPTEQIVFCRNCGTQLDDQAVACVKCGVNPRAGASFCYHCGKPTVPAAVVCMSCGVALAAPALRDPRADTKIAAGICGIILGSLGVHKFILGYTGAGLVMLLVTLLTCFLASPVMSIIGIIEGILYLTKSDEEFVRTYVVGRKDWF